MEKSYYINKKIKLEENSLSSVDAITKARKYIKNEGLDPMMIKGFIYLVGPDVSDLIIVSPQKKEGKLIKLRACTDNEWNKYFKTFIYDNRNNSNTTR